MQLQPRRHLLSVVARKPLLMTTAKRRRKVRPNHPRRRPGLPLLRKPRQVLRRRIMVMVPKRRMRSPSPRAGKVKPRSRTSKTMASMKLPSRPRAGRPLPRSRLRHLTKTKRRPTNQSRPRRKAKPLLPTPTRRLLPRRLSPRRRLPSRRMRPSLSPRPRSLLLQPTKIRTTATLPERGKQRTTTLSLRLPLSQSLRRSTMPLRRSPRPRAARLLRNPRLLPLMARGSLLGTSDIASQTEGVSAS